MEGLLLAINTVLLPFLRFPDILSLRTLCKDTNFSWVLIPKKLTIKITEVSHLWNFVRLVGRLAGKINLQICLSNSGQLVERALDSFPSQMPTIAGVEIFSSNQNPTFLNFLSRLPLRSISFNGFPINDTLFSNLFNTRFANLQTLILAECGYDLTDVSLALITRQCPNLIHLKLLCCTNITFRSINYVAEHLSLISLDLTGCNIFDAALYFIARIQTLRNLSLEGCDYIGDEGIYYLCNCSQLEYLNISYCEQLSGECFKVVYYLKKLKIFLAFHINNVTNLSLAWLTRAQPQRQPQRQPRRQSPTQIWTQPPTQQLYAGLTFSLNEIRHIMYCMPLLIVGGENNYIDKFPPNIYEAIMEWR